MPKAILEFKLPEEEEEFEYAKNGIKYSIVIGETLNWLRNKVKYQDQKTIEIEEVREYIYSQLNDRDLQF